VFGGWGGASSHGASLIGICSPEEGNLLREKRSSFRETDTIIFEAKNRDKLKGPLKVQMNRVVLAKNAQEQTWLESDSNVVIPLNRKKRGVEGGRSKKKTVA